MRSLIYYLLKLKYLIGPNRGNSKKYLDNWGNSFIDQRKYYLAAYRYYKLFLDTRLKKHREYFQKERRGFGEAAFHTMWYLLYQKYKFKNFLEIGVYRGQVMSLVSYLSKLDDCTIAINGISPFDKSGDTVSKYIEIDYIEDIYKNFEKFSLQKPTLTNAYSTDGIAKEIIASHQWDCIYIDGSHDYEIVLEDWKLCAAYTKIGGIIVIDDSSLYTKYKPAFFAFAGHPGPSKVADEVDNNSFKEVLRVGHNRVFQKIK